MTETLCSCLTAVLLWALACDWKSGHVAQNASPSFAVVTGVLWGLCLLARPTYAAAFGLWLLASVRPRLRFGLVAGIVALAVLSPWAIRNWMVFGRPIVTTTHGGYTLWLANNPVYYSEVIEGHEPVWNGESLNRWQTETTRDMDRLHLQGEVAQDRWQSQQAREFIQANPWRFARACLHRALTFWSIWPGRAAESQVPGTVLGLIAGGYSALWLGVIVATLRAIHLGRGSLLLPAGCLILGFVAVHLVYWTDARMRAPVMPAVAIVIAVGLKRQGGGETITGTSSQINHSSSNHVSSSHPTSLSAPQ